MTEGLRGLPFWLLRASGDAVLEGSAGGTVTVTELLAQAAAVAAVLPAPRPGSHVAFAFERDRHAFAVALLGTWLAGHAAALPETASRVVVAPVLAREEVVEFLHDTGAGRGHYVPGLLRDGSRFSAVAAAAPGAGDEVAWTGFALDWQGALRSDAYSVAATRRCIEDVRAGATAESRAAARALCPMYPPALVAALLIPLREAGRVTGAVTGDPRAGAVGVRSVSSLAELVPPAHREPVADALAGAALEVDGIADAVALRLSAEADAGHAVAVVGDSESAGAKGDAVRARLAAMQKAGAVAVHEVAEIARDANGRPQRNAVLAACHRDRTGVRLTCALRFEPAPADASALGAGWQCYRVHVPPRYAFFAGHFSGYPVLAGAVQLHELVLPCVRRANPALGDLRRLNGLKFAARIAPGDTLTVAVLAPPGSGRVEFCVRRAATRCSFGRLEFASVDTAPATVDEVHPG